MAIGRFIMDKDTKDMSLHPGGTELTKDAFKTAMKSTASFREKKVTLMTEDRKAPEKKIPKILDVGCGTGASLAALRDEYGIEAFGIDRDERTVERARELHPGISFSACDAAYLPYNEESFDGILSECMLTLLADPKEALSEWKRVLKTGGFMIISGMCERDTGDLNYAFRTSFPYDAESSVIIRNGLLDKEALRSYAQYLGLVCVHERDCREELFSYASEAEDCDPRKVSYVLMIFKKS